MSGNLHIVSFSYKHGLPPTADTVFDMRFLRNPFYDPALSALTGLDDAVGAYIESDPDFAGFWQHATVLLLLLLPRYLEKKDFTIALGCTGGRHRSVHVAKKLGEFLQAKDYNITVLHRDIPL